MAKRRHKHVSVLVIPDDGSRTLEFKLNYLQVWGVGGLLGGLLAMVLLGGLFFWQARYWKRSAEELVLDNARLRQEATRVDELAQTVSRMKAWDQQLRTMLSGKVSLPPESYSMPVAGHREVEGQATTLRGHSPSGGTGDWADRWVPAIWPVSPASGWVSREFETQRGLFQNRHLGIDIAAPEGTPVQAAADGRVVFAGTEDVLGHLITLDHGGVYMTRYGHNGALLVSQGEEVRRGQHIALVGNSGQSSGPHLHYEVIQDGQHRNPRDFLPR